MFFPRLNSPNQNYLTSINKLCGLNQSFQSLYKLFFSSLISMNLIVNYYPQAKSFIKEDITSLIGNKSIDLFDNYCIINDVSVKEISKLVFLLQAARRIGIYLGKANYESNISDSFNHLKKSLNLDALKTLSSNISSFAVDSVKLANISIPTPDISATIGNFVSDFLADDVEVDLRNPDLKILSLVSSDEVILCVDIIGFPLSKRPYKITAHAGSLNGVFAYTIARLVGYTKNKILVDPFCGGAPIPIECALFNNEKSAFTFENKFKAFSMPFFKDEFSHLSEELNNKECSKNKIIYGYDYMLKVLNSAQKNSKLSGVFDALQFSKVNIDWIDSKFDEGAVDFIISNPPQISNRNNNKKDILKVYDELFFQAKYLLSKTGILGILLICTEEVEDIATKHKLKLIEEIPISSGGQKYTLLKFKRSI